MCLDTQKETEDARHEVGKKIQSQTVFQTHDVITGMEICRTLQQNWPPSPWCSCGASRHNLERVCQWLRQSLIKHKNTNETTRIGMKDKSILRSLIADNLDIKVREIQDGIHYSAAGNGAAGDIWICHSEPGSGCSRVTAKGHVHEHKSRISTSSQYVKCLLFGIGSKLTCPRN